MTSLGEMTRAGARLGIALGGVGPSSARQPHQLEALRARVGHPEVAYERNETALPMVRAARTDGGGLGVDRGDAQGPARRGTGDHGGTGFVT
jgi:hypothetical protein